MAGANVVYQAAGWLESGLVTCFEKFVLDIELLQLLRRQFTPVTFDEERSPSPRTPRSGRAATSWAPSTAAALSRVLLAAGAGLDGELRALEEEQLERRSGARREALARPPRALRAAAAPDDAVHAAAEATSWERRTRELGDEPFPLPGAA